MEKILSARYAKALLDLALEEDVVDEAAADLRAMAGLLEEHGELEKLFASPLIDCEAKLKPLERVLAGASDLAKRFMRLLVRNGRISILAEIAADYERMADEELGRATAHVETAGPLADAQVEAIRRQLERLTKKKIAADVSVNESILAGIRARVGDRIYDGSLLGKLEEMRQVLTG